jgi:hypothetical protein
MVNICDTAHGHERDVVQYPSDDGVDTGVVNLVHVGLLQVVVTTLPADGVKEDEENKDAKTSGTTPIDERVAQKEVLDDCSVLDKRIP